MLAKLAYFYIYLINCVSCFINYALNYFCLIAASPSSKRSRSPLREPPLDVNVARGKPAKQSSSANPYMCEASKAVDGMLISDKKKNSCSLTKSQLGAWWEVDLGAVYEIHAVVITSPNSGELTHGTSETRTQVQTHLACIHAHTRTHAHAAAAIATYYMLLLLRLL